MAKTRDAGLNTLCKNNVLLRGAGERTMVFSHGLGCDLNA
jgi:hypothetical protein